MPPTGARADATLPVGFSDHLVASGLDNPVGLAFLPDGRLLLIERTTAKVRLFIADTLASPNPLLVVDSVRTDYNERGLLGIAVDARWPTRPYLYVDYTTTRAPAVWVSRYTVTGDLSFTGDGQLAIDPASRYDVITDMVDLNGPHNGGTLRFGPDGMLYVSIGEDFTPCQAQDLTMLGGKILRVDVGYLPDGPGGPPAKSLITPPFNPIPPGANGNGGLIWAYGFRNPFRFHIDMRTGILYVVDVGAATYEEVDRVDESGLNFGWPYYEGTLYTETCPGASSVGLTAPIYMWDRSHQPVACCMSAGLYRVKPRTAYSFPAAYDGDYFFTDLASGWMRRLKKSADGTWWPAPPVPGQVDSITWASGFVDAPDFLEGPDGALYYCQLGPGQLRKVVCDFPLDVPLANGADRPVLAAPWPSPAAGMVHFAYTLQTSGAASLEVYDVTGRRVRTLFANQWVPAQRRVVTWDGRMDGGGEAAPGVYFARLSVGPSRWDQRFAWLR
ncbi:MAG: PQQ-dependent sugar dehydrogenase [Candidatus Eisenbacteria bacterium]